MKLSNVLPQYHHTGDIALQSQKTLRKLVGILGILLPIILYLFLQITNNFDPILPSISHYYFTRAGSFFLIVISLLAIFLIIYKGEDPIDFVLSGLAGFSALLLLIFPTNNLKGYLNGKFDAVAVTYFTSSDFRPKFHYFNAAIFLLSLAFMSLFLFTKSNSAPASRTRNKKIRNRIYRICGVIMLGALLTTFLGFLKVINSNYYDSHNLTFWTEVISLEAFGISWMVKGELILAD